MNRHSWKDWFEVVGVASIVVTLGFVAYEIRQNTDAVRSAAIQDISRFSYDATVLSIEKDELREARLAACGGELSEDQAFLLRMYYAALIRIQMNRFYQARLGILDEETILSLAGRGGAYRNPYFAEIWPLLKLDFDDDFKEYIERDVLPLSQDGC